MCQTVCLKQKQVNCIHVSTVQIELEMTNKAAKAVKTVKCSRKAQRLLK